MSRIRISGTNSYDIYTITYHNKDPRLVRDVVQSLLTILVEGSFSGKKNDSQKAVHELRHAPHDASHGTSYRENAVSATLHYRF